MSGVKIDRHTALGLIGMGVGRTVGGYTVVADQYEDDGRWSAFHTCIVSADAEHGALYGLSYELGLTENQDPDPFDDAQEIELFRVVPKPRHIIEYVREEG